MVFNCNHARSCLGLFYCRAKLAKKRSNCSIERFTRERAVARSHCDQDGLRIAELSRNGKLRVKFESPWAIAGNATESYVMFLKQLLHRLDTAAFNFLSLCAVWLWPQVNRCGASLCNLRQYFGERGTPVEC